MKLYIVVEDDADIRRLVKLLFSRDPNFEVIGETDSAEECLEILKAVEEEGLIVLDHTLEGELDGISAAPHFKEVAPKMKIILFTADSNLRARAKKEPAIDAFVVKTEIVKLLPTARRLCGLE